MKTVFVSLVPVLAPSVAFAHGGHGADGAHWHATDVWGFVVAGGLALALALWFGRGGK